MSHLKLVLGGNVDPESLSPTQLAVKTITDALRQIANGVDSMGRSGLSLTTRSIDCTDSEIEEIKAALAEQCLLWGKVARNAGDLSTTIDPESLRKFRAANPTATSAKVDLQILVTLVTKATQKRHKPALATNQPKCNWNFVCSELHGVPSELYTILPGDEIYYFNSQDWKSDNPYLGKRFYEIEEYVIRKHGRRSEVFTNIQRVVELCRSLHCDNLGTDTDADADGANELRELILRVGPAARAIVQDFDRDAYDNEGWEPVDDND